MKRQQTALEIAFAQAMERSGKPAQWYGRRLAENGATARQVNNAMATLRAHLRRGNASLRYANRVAALLDIDPQSRLVDLLLKPRSSWPAWALAPEGASNTSQEATGTPRKHVSVASRSGAGFAAGSASKKSPRTSSKRMVILEVL